MNKSKLALVVLGLIISRIASSNTPESATDIENLKASPELISQSGKNRIRDHIQIIDRNITNTESNIQATKKNIGVIETELKELDNLKKEHLSLKSRYLSFVATANRETAKNNKALNEIEDFEKRVENLTNKTTNSSQFAELEAAKTEKKQREEWKKETQQKTLRISELLVGVERNLQSIEGKRAPLIEQLKTWGNRQKEYEALLITLSQKKKVAEKFLTTPKTQTASDNQ